MNVKYDKYNTEYQMSTCLEKIEVLKSIVATVEVAKISTSKITLRVG